MPYIDYFIQLHYKKYGCIDTYKFNQADKFIGFIYERKEYILDSNLNLKSEIKGNKVPYEWTISEISGFFDVEVEYDYENRIINLSLYSYLE